MAEKNEKEEEYTDSEDSDETEVANPKLDETEEDAAEEKPESEDLDAEY